MRIIIEEIPFSPNGPKGLLRMHWAKRAKYNKHWQLLVRSQIPYIADKPNVRKKVSISQMRKRLLDPDNLVASVKPILDAIVKCNLVYDDSPEWIELECMQQQGKPQITIIEIRG